MAIKKPIDADLELRYQTALEIAEIEAGYIRTRLRDEFAKAIMTGIIAADWKFDLAEKKWDEIAAKRAYELADAMIKEREIENV